MQCGLFYEASEDPQRIHDELLAETLDLIVYGGSAIHVMLVQRFRVTVDQNAADARWSFVQNQANTPWGWRAMDASTRQSMALHGGARRRASANALWAKRPLVYREPARCHTDHYAVYKGGIPADRPKAIPKKARKPKHIERFQNTLRQRLSRFVRATVSCSKTVEHHIGASQYFICWYNLAKAATYPVALPVELDHYPLHRRGLQLKSW